MKGGGHMKPNKIPKKLRLKSVVFVSLLFSFSCFCEKGGTMSIAIESPAFAQNQAIPSKYTCNGPDVSPPLAWKNIPDKTQSIVLICDDPDAPGGTWVHWVCYDIPASVTTLPEGILKIDSLPGGGKQGITDFGGIGYGGPCPPSGTHRYFFKVYALDRMLGVPAGKSKKDIERAMKGHVVAQGQLIGMYSKK
jgi:Raf kinase inhibitor-like YbhB/YbcL family protein